MIIFIIMYYQMGLSDIERVNMRYGDSQPPPNSTRYLSSICSSPPFFSNRIVVNYQLNLCLDQYEIIDEILELFFVYQN